MKANIQAPFLVFSDYSEAELKSVEKLLSWKYTDRQVKQLKKEAIDQKLDPKEVKTSQTLLLNNESTYYTYWGFYDVLSSLKFPIQISNTPELETNFGKIDSCLLAGIELYGFQVSAIRKALINQKGIIDSPTGSGKTEIMLGIIKMISNEVSSVLIVTPSVYLAKQAIERALKRGFDEKEIGSLFGGSRNIQKVTVAVINSLNIGIKKGDKEVIDLVTNSQALLIDECHHAKAATNTKVILMSKAKYVLGFSGSPFQESSTPLSSYDDATTYGLLGKPIFKVSQRHLRSLGVVATPFAFFKLIIGKMMRSPYWHNLYKTHIVDQKKRNKFIVEYATKFSELNCPTLILIQQKKHAFNLLAKLPPEKTVCIFGDGTYMVNEVGMIESFKLSYETFLQKFNKGEWNIVIATQVFDEGVDVPSIGVVIMAGAGRSYKKILQRVGRGVRKKVNRLNQTYIVDFMDRTHIYLFAQYKKRKAIYEELEIDVIENETDFMNKICDHYKR